jgi:hypothetical protein
MDITAAGLSGKLVKRAGAKNYQIHFRHPQSRARQRVSLGTGDLATAKARGKHLLETTGRAGLAALKEHARRDTSATVGAACEHYLAVSTVAFKRDNVNCLYRVIRAALETENGAKVRGLPLSRLNARLVSDYLRKAKVAAVTKKSSLASARAVFCRLTDWEGFDGLPDMRPFREAATGTGLRSDFDAFRPLPKEALDAMEAQTILHGGAYRRAYILARYCGLRPREIAGFRTTWLEDRGGQHYLCVRQRPQEDFTLKTGSRGERDIGLPAELATELLACDDYGVPGGTPYTRYNWLLRTYNGFLREFMPGREQFLYTLRKQAGSDWLTATGKISLVSRLLGHSSPSTTARHYATHDNAVVMPESVWQR